MEKTPILNDLVVNFVRTTELFNTTFPQRPALRVFLAFMQNFLQDTQKTTFTTADLREWNKGKPYWLDTNNPIQSVYGGVQYCWIEAASGHIRKIIAAIASAPNPSDFPITFQVEQTEIKGARGSLILIFKIIPNPK